MDIVYQREQVFVADVMEALPDALSNSAVRTHLRILEEKGQLKHIEEGGKFIYVPTNPRHAAARSALAQVMKTFFDGSVENVMATLLSAKESELSTEELDRLRTMIDQAKGACH